MRNRIVAVLIALLTVGCGDDSTTTTDDAPPAVCEETTASEGLFDVIWFEAESTFFELELSYDGAQYTALPDGFSGEAVIPPGTELVMDQNEDGCVPQPLIGLKLCQYSAEGERVEGAAAQGVIPTILLGHEVDDASVTPNVDSFIAWRRDAVSGCSPTGVYDIDSSEVTLRSGELDDATLEVVLDQILGTFGIVEIGQGRRGAEALLLVGLGATDLDVPGSIVFNAAARSLELNLTTGIAREDAGDIPVELELVGSLDNARGQLNADVNIRVQADDGRAILRGSLTGTRR